MPGCGFAIQVRPATALYAQERDGLHCGRRACSYRPPAAPPGLVTEITWNAAGSFSGWRHAFPGGEDIASIGRAQDLLAAGQARQPGSAAQATMKALAAPAGPGDHIVTGGSWSTSVSAAPGGSIEIENPMVCAGLHRMVANGDEAGIIVRGFSSKISPALPDGTGIPVKDVRGWRLSEGIFRPIAGQGIFAACCTGARNGEPSAPERGVRYADACPVEA